MNPLAMSLWELLSRRTRHVRCLAILWPGLVYFVLALVVVVLVHEGAHILVAVAYGVPFSQIDLGFYGINPSVRYPGWFEGTGRTIAFYAGGFAAGTVALATYAYWLRRFRRERSARTWVYSFVTILLVAWQLSNGYLEGRYLYFYVAGSASLFSGSNLLMGYWVLAAAVIHYLLNPRRLIEEWLPIREICVESQRRNSQ